MSCAHCCPPTTKGKTMRKFLMAAALVAVAVPAFAQTQTPPANPNANTPAVNSPNRSAGIGRAVRRIHRRRVCIWICRWIRLRLSERRNCDGHECRRHQKFTHGFSFVVGGKQCAQDMHRSVARRVFIRDTSNDAAISKGTLLVMNEATCPV